ncbi:MerR family transcriptional regulator [Brevibacillus laterosporus]|uniref:MerR family transcriptional regulator n=1 Tax=Brevibacillus laterosporus TaxID=1465 RepID=UPI0026542810|nr:MerR family transcriptional regulator [Brevibacillus laterosporus]MDN9010600.1 MerR family transcriptional regulator [Brevibacillus laterosporus]MDO0941491.1 MerR family transcriptional regulator [Brevibacillus laterosporus]
MEYKEYRTGEFAKVAGVSIRTLRYYDKVGLLSPAKHAENGFRIYTSNDLAKLQQILTLKYLGFSLGEIKALQQIQPVDLEESLQMQKKLMKEKREKLDQVISALDYASLLVKQEQSVKWDAIIDLIKVIHLEDKHWWKKYYTEEQLILLHQRQEMYTEMEQKRDTLSWNIVIEGFKKAFAQNKAVESEEVQKLAHEWQSLIYAFTKGDADMYRSLHTAHTKSPLPMPYTETEGIYIQEALAVYTKRQVSENGQADM